MMSTKWSFTKKVAAVAVVATGLTLVFNGNAAAHCDTLDGPVVKDARKALEAKDVAPVLKWVREKDENTIRAAFNKALAAKGKKNAGAAETEFFETLVRVHREGEGASFTGLKPEGAVDPAVAEADKALASGSADSLVKLIADAATTGINQRYRRVAATFEHKDESVAAGREFVEAYVEFTHYVEGLYRGATGKGP